MPKAASSLRLQAGTTALAPLVFASGSNLSTPLQGAVEWDGVNAFLTGNTSTGGGRQISRLEQRVYLATGASAIAANTDFFPSLRPAMLAGRLYHFKMHLIFSKNTAGTVTWQLKNSAAVNFTLLSAVLVTFVQGAVLAAVGNTANVHAAAAATATAPATASLANTANCSMVVEGFCIPASNTRLSIAPSAYGAGTITTVAGSNLVITDLGLISTAVHGNVG